MKSHKQPIIKSHEQIAEEMTDALIKERDDKWVAEEKRRHFQYEIDRCSALIKEAQVEIATTKS